MNKKYFLASLLLLTLLFLVYHLNKSTVTTKKIDITNEVTSKKIETKKPSIEKKDITQNVKEKTVESDSNVEVENEKVSKKIITKNIISKRTKQKFIPVFKSRNPNLANSKIEFIFHNVQSGEVQINVITEEPGKHASFSALAEIGTGRIIKTWNRTINENHKDPHGKIRFTHPALQQQD